MDPRDLDELLTEMTLISARAELYKNFILKSIITDLNSASPASNSSVSDDYKNKLSRAQSFINSSNLQCSMQELIGHYSILENYFMTENMYKAIQMDTFSKDSINSSVVDDVFFIIKKCIK